MYIKVNEILSKEEQIECFKSLKTETDKDKIKIIEEKLFLTYYRLVLKIASKFNLNKVKIIDYDDICSVGSNGLLKAIRSYDIDKNFAFSTYATSCVSNEMRMALNKNKRTKEETSLQEPMFSGGEQDCLQIEDTIADKTDIIEEASERSEKEYKKEFIEKIFNRDLLSKQEKKVLTLRFGLFGGKALPTVQKVADELKLSRSRVNFVLNTALSKMKRYIDMVNKKCEEKEDRIL